MESASIVTGEPVADTGVPGNEWFSREENKFYAPAPVSVEGQGDAFRMLNDGLVGNALQVPTLFELIDGRSHVSLLPVYRGADLFTVPDPNALGEIFATFASGITDDSTISEEVYRHIDTESVETVIEALHEHGIPDLQVVYFPGVDLYTHNVEDPMQHQDSYIEEVIFPAVTKVLDHYEQAGELQRTWIIFVSDHGHTPVLNDDAHSLGVDGEDEPTAVLEDLGFRVRGPELESEDDTHQAVVAYQGAIAYVYLADRSTCEGEDDVCDWNAAPRYEEDVLPVAKAFFDAAQSEDGSAGLAGALDMVLTREPCRVGGGTAPFEVFDGEKRVPIAAWLEEHPRPDLLAFEPRMKALSVGPFGHRVGDVMLLTKTGLENPIEDRFYFSNPYRSWHGSPSEADSNITFVVAHAGHSGIDVERRVREIAGDAIDQTDVTPLIQSLLAD